MQCVTARHLDCDSHIYSPNSSAESCALIRKVIQMLIRWESSLKIALTRSIESVQGNLHLAVSRVSICDFTCGPLSSIPFIRFLLIHHRHETILSSAQHFQLQVHRKCCFSLLSNLVGSTSPSGSCENRNKKLKFEVVLNVTIDCAV